MSSGLHPHLLKLSFCCGRHERACGGAKATWPSLMSACHRVALGKYTLLRAAGDAATLYRVVGEPVLTQAMFRSNLSCLGDGRSDGSG
jgi:hypothetical protein